MQLTWMGGKGKSERQQLYFTFLHSKTKIRDLTWNTFPQTCVFEQSKVRHNCCLFNFTLSSGPHKLHTLFFSQRNKRQDTFWTKVTNGFYFKSLLEKVFPLARTLLNRS